LLELRQRFDLGRGASPEAAGSPQPQVQEPGDFAVRGALSICSMGSAEPYRIELF
jgi:transcription-repair coupling factor (superfamily II helicase)